MSALWYAIADSLAGLALGLFSVCCLLHANETVFGIGYCQTLVARLTVIDSHTPGVLPAESVLQAHILMSDVHTDLLAEELVLVEEFSGHSDFRWDITVIPCVVELEQ